MKKLFILAGLFAGAPAFGQILYDPTTVHAAPGQLYDINNVYTIELEFYDPNYHATLTAWKESYDESTLPAQLDYGGYHFDSVAVKYKGNSTFGVANFLNNPKVPYNIDLNDYVAGQDIQGRKKLKLGNAFFDPTFAKEALASSIYKQYMPCYEVSLVRLIVNGDYLGVYVNQEDIGNAFLKKYFGEKDGPFFKCEPMTEEQAGHPVEWPNLLWLGSVTLDYYESYERKSTGGWNEFIGMINTLNNSPGDIEQVLNVDRVLWNFAVSTVLSNEDAYNTAIVHNYYMYQTADGKFQMIPWDLTESFCGILFSTGTPESHYEFSPLNGYDPYLSDRPLVHQLLSVSYYRKKYLAHIRTIMEEFYTAATLKTWIQDLQALAYTAIETDPNRPHSLAKMVQNIDDPVNWLLLYTIAGVTDVVTQRDIYLQGHPEVSKVPPVIHSVSQSIQHPSSSETVYVSADVTNAIGVTLKVTNNPAKYASDFQAIAMLDDGLNGDAIAGDHIYTAAVPFTNSNDHIKYYIEATNADAMMLEPQHAEYFYYHYYVDQVVALHESENNPEIRLYPNPVSDRLTIDTPTGAPYLFRLYDLQGHLVISEELHGGISQIDVTGYAKGTYIVETIINDKKDRRKLVIN